MVCWKLELANWLNSFFIIKCLLKKLNSVNYSKSQRLSICLLPICRASYSSVFQVLNIYYIYLCFWVNSKCQLLTLINSDTDLHNHIYIYTLTVQPATVTWTNTQLYHYRIDSISKHVGHYCLHVTFIPLSIHGLHICVFLNNVIACM